MTIRVEDLDRMDFSDVAQGDKLPPVKPGEILLEEILFSLLLCRLFLALFWSLLLFLGRHRMMG